MVYNLQKFKMDKSFGIIEDQDLEATQMNSRRPTQLNVGSNVKILP